MSQPTEKTDYYGEKNRPAEILFGTLLAIGALGFIWISTTILLHLSSYLY